MTSQYSTLCLWYWSARETRVPPGLWTAARAFRRLLVIVMIIWSSFPLDYHRFLLDRTCTRKCRAWSQIQGKTLHLPSDGWLPFSMLAGNIWLYLGARPRVSSPQMILLRMETIMFAVYQLYGWLDFMADYQARAKPVDPGKQSVATKRSAQSVQCQLIMNHMTIWLRYWPPPLPPLPPSPPPWVLLNDPPLFARIQWLCCNAWRLVLTKLGLSTPTAMNRSSG